MYSTVEENWFKVFEIFMSGYSKWSRKSRKVALCAQLNSGPRNSVKHSQNSIKYLYKF